MNIDAQHPPRTPDEARAIGWKRYHGKPCGYGHEGWRYLTHDDCVDCVKERVKRQKLGLATKRTIGIRRREEARKAAKLAKEQVANKAATSVARPRLERPSWFVENINLSASR